MSTEPTSSSLLDELATLFEEAPTLEMILEFRPSPSSIDRANRSLEMSRQKLPDEDARQELEPFEQSERLMRLVKARLRANHTGAMPPRLAPLFRCVSAGRVLSTGDRSSDFETSGDPRLNSLIGKRRQDLARQTDLSNTKAIVDGLNPGSFPLGGCRSGSAIGSSSNAERSPAQSRTGLCRGRSLKGNSSIAQGSPRSGYPG